ncbi:MAG: ribosome-associated translation inhibitor RaiA [Myxococcota bacterium]|jgi:putative sigma-54 modulation protein|nr:ribosome-associated translation inhibitor RaiA [Myxococcota bacterium]
MQVYISFRHMEPSDPLKQYADEKVRRMLRKHIRDNFDAQVTLSIEKFRHIANFLLNYQGFSIKCEESSDDMYSSIDLALDKLERQLRRYKDKLRSHKPAERRERDQSFNFSVLAAPEDLPEDEAAEAEESVEAAPVEEAPEPAPSVRVIKRETMTVPHMSVDDAIMAADLEQLSSLIFVNTETQRVNVLERLPDGNFGLLET